MKKLISIFMISAIFTSVGNYFISPGFAQENINKYTIDKAIEYYRASIKIQAIYTKEGKRDWDIIKGEFTSLSDYDLLILAGYTVEAESVKKEMESNDTYREMGRIIFAVGAGIIGGAIGMKDGSYYIYSGGLISLIGLGMYYQPAPRHYIDIDKTIKIVDEYNIKLKEKLGLSQE